MLNLITKRGLVSKTRALVPVTSTMSPTGVPSVRRPYFSVFEKVKDRFNTPMRHIKSFMEPDGVNYESQVPEGYRLHGNSAASFSASMT